MRSSAHIHAEELRQAGLEEVRRERHEAAIVLYDRALAISIDDEQTELLTINKADAMIALGINGPEVQKLPAILMHRQSLHHTFLAAYALMYKYRMQGDAKRTIFYGQVALDAAVEANDPLWKIGVFNDLGIASEMDSQFEAAIGYFDSALALLSYIEDEAEREMSEAAIVPNLAYNKMLAGQTAEGVQLMHEVMDRIQSPSGLADSYIALCYGYLDLGKYEEATHFGEIGLELATSEREIRNAHYLTGEAAYKSGNVESAERHFEELARFYPEFRNLKSLLYAFDLRSMVNFRL